MSARSASSDLTADSTLAVISVAGMFVGVTAKFRPFFNRVSSASLRDLALSTYVFALLTVFGGIKAFLTFCARI